MEIITHILVHLSHTLHLFNLPNGKIVNFNNRLYYYDGANKYILNQNDYNELNQNIQTISSNLNSVISNSVKYGRGTFSKKSSYTVKTSVTSFVLLIVCAIFYNYSNTPEHMEFVFIVNNSDDKNFTAYDGTISNSSVGSLQIINNGFTISNVSKHTTDEGGQYYYAYFT